MQTQDDIIKGLAAIDLTKVFEADTQDAMRRLVTQARIVAKGLGPTMRSAGATERADDYQGACQIAIALGYDGKLETMRRTDCPPHALIPLMGALGHEISKMGRESAKAIGMEHGDYSDAVEKMEKLIRDGEYEAATKSVTPDDSRTDQPPNLIISG